MNKHKIEKKNLGDNRVDEMFGLGTADGARLLLLDRLRRYGGENSGDFPSPATRKQRRRRPGRNNGRPIPPVPVEGGSLWRLELEDIWFKAFCKRNRHHGCGWNGGSHWLGVSTERRRRRRLLFVSPKLKKKSGRDPHIISLAASSRPRHRNSFLRYPNPQLSSDLQITVLAAFRISLIYLKYF